MFLDSKLQVHLLLFPLEASVLLCAKESLLLAFMLQFFANIQYFLK